MFFSRAMLRHHVEPGEAMLRHGEVAGKEVCLLAPLYQSRDPDPTGREPGDGTPGIQWDAREDAHEDQCSIDMPGSRNEKARTGCAPPRINTARTPARITSSTTVRTFASQARQPHWMQVQAAARRPQPQQDPAGTKRDEARRELGTDESRGIDKIEDQNTPGAVNRSRRESKRGQESKPGNGLELPAISSEKEGPDWEQKDKVRRERQGGNNGSETSPNQERGKQRGEERDAHNINDTNNEHQRSGQTGANGEWNGRMGARTRNAKGEPGGPRAPGTLAKANKPGGASRIKSSIFFGSVYPGNAVKNGHKGAVKGGWLRINRGRDLKGRMGIPGKAGRAEGPGERGSANAGIKPGTRPNTKNRGGKKRGSENSKKRAIGNAEGNTAEDEGNVERGRATAGLGGREKAPSAAKIPEAHMHMSGDENGGQSANENQLQKAREGQGGRINVERRGRGRAGQARGNQPEGGGGAAEAK